ncbi:Protein of unknown function [Cotesia congregata]|uniref:Uncharacterized protein n=1 Tax=Cotesia congregata TaxID=51543 RepID=A0A8J2HQ73_COTCN|nr:Protein of unknown function [Cotesia congregata]
MANMNGIADNIYPFLAITVLQIIDGFRIPHFSDTEEIPWKETILSHDNEVHEESSSCLDHTNLSVRHRDKPGR